MKSLYNHFQMQVEVPRIRKGKNQQIETLINEEALLFAKYLTDERETWIPTDCNSTIDLQLISCLSNKRDSGNIAKKHFLGIARR